MQPFVRIKYLHKCEAVMRFVVLYFVNLTRAAVWGVLSNLALDTS